MTFQLCPRCYHNRFTPYGEDMHRDEEGNPDGPPYPALSRVADIYICSECGTDEAMRDHAQEPPIPPNEWPIKAFA